MIRDTIALVLFSAALFCLAMGAVVFFTGCRPEGPHLRGQRYSEDCKSWVEQCTQTRIYEECVTDSRKLGCK